MKNNTSNILFSVSLASFLGSLLFAFYVSDYSYSLRVAPNCSFPPSSNISAYIGLGIIFGLFYTTHEKILQSRLLAFGYGLILGGGLFNSLEKIVYSCVTDYFDFFGIFYFNLPDILISIGILTFIYILYIKNPLPDK